MIIDTIPKAMPINLFTSCAIGYTGRKKEFMTMIKKNYCLINQQDGNRIIEIDASTEKGAYQESLDKLGWSLCVKKKGELK